MARDKLKEHLEDIRKSYLGGETTTSIAKRLNVSTSSIIYRLKTLGIYTVKYMDTDDIRDYTIEMYASMHSTKEIAKELNISEYKVEIALKKCGIIGHRDITASKIDKLVEMYNNGDMLVDIAKHLDISVNTVRNRIKSLGLNSRDLDKERLTQDVIKLYNEHHSISAVSKITGKAGGVISGILFKQGIKTDCTLDIDEDALVDYYNTTSSSIRKTAKMFGISEFTARDILIGKNVHKVNSNGKLKTDDDEILTLYKAGNSLSEISSQLGISRNTVRSRLIEAGEYKIRTKKVIGDVDEIVKCYNEYSRVGIVAKKLGISKAVITNVLRKNGIDVIDDILKTNEGESFIVNEYTNGKTVEDLAKKYCTSQAVISGILKYNNIDVRRDCKIDIDLDYVKQLLDSGIPLTQISKQIGVAYSTIRKRLIYNGMADSLKRKK